jgi:undecaprenyl diphosphate synthase
MKTIQHIAFIMDGNGRWAKALGKSRQEGHKAGFDNLVEILKECKAMGLSSVTCYAFSTENWSRPKPEIDFLMNIPMELYKQRKQELLDTQIKIQFVGRRDRLPQHTLQAIEQIETDTSQFIDFTGYIAFDYGSQDELVRVVNKLLADSFISSVDEALISSHLEVPAIDLLIRTSGEVRLSNFLLWQSAYAELLFVDTYWPDFTPARLHEALEEYNKRSRRFGGLKE